MFRTTNPEEILGSLAGNSRPGLWLAWEDWPSAVEPARRLRCPPDRAKRRAGYQSTVSRCYDVGAIGTLAGELGAAW